MYSLVRNERNLVAVQILEAHKGQPTVEKRFEQLKAVHQAAPLFLKNPGAHRGNLHFLALWSTPSSCAMWSR